MYRSLSRMNFNIKRAFTISVFILSGFLCSWIFLFRFETKRFHTVLIQIAKTQKLLRIHVMGKVKIYSKAQFF